MLRLEMLRTILFRYNENLALVLFLLGQILKMFLGPNTWRPFSNSRFGQFSLIFFLYKALLFERKLSSLTPRVVLRTRRVLVVSYDALAFLDDASDGLVDAVEDRDTLAVGHV